MSCNFHSFRVYKMHMLNSCHISMMSPAPDKADQHAGWPQALVFGTINAAVGLPALIAFAVRHEQDV